MQVLAINGSARGGKGVTAKLLTALTRGMEEGGARVETLEVRGLKIAPCLACLACMHDTPGQCAQSDDMERVYPLLKAADLLLLAAPVYTDGYPAPLKALIDRCICAMRPYLTTDQAGRVRHPMTWRLPERFALLSTSGFPEPATFAPLVATFRAQAANFGSRPVAEFCVPGSLALQMSPEHLEAHLPHLTRAGRELAAEGCVRPHTLARVNRPPMSQDAFRQSAARYEAWCRKRLGDDPA